MTNNNVSPHIAINRHLSQPYRNQHIHFIGICGVAMSALALAFKDKGWRVTGSDKGFYPPVSTHLKDAGVSFYPGWHPEKMTENGIPDLVVVGNVAGSNNPEWLFVQKNDIPYASYPEVIAQYFVKEHSLVCAGTYGKSTSTAALVWIFQHAGISPSYMFGGVSNNNVPAATLGDTEWSILEGDEYKSSGWDEKAKFFHYNPTHLLLTSIVWDHADVYPNASSYKEAFSNLVAQLPKDGLFTVSEKVRMDYPHFLENVACPVVTYGKEKKNTYQYTNIATSTSGITFDIIHDGTTYHVATPLLGDYMADNFTGCFATAHQAGIAPETIVSAIGTFQNIKRRLEKKYEGKITIFDDIAHSPKKAEAVLNSLRALYDGKIIAIFEPNIGNRQPDAAPGYTHAFDNADMVILPRFSPFKKNPKLPQPFEAHDLQHIISQTHGNVVAINDDAALLEMVNKETNAGDVVVFLGSHGFRGMIEELVLNLSL
ncbi:MAG: hypothetical protein A3G08_03595 [Candidatus Magasanikbacteria bacterium RIFCSPLOWO2_12_FULL_47_9b]|nr:MAG: hypothetical protein A3G08_03595 [Candidatus Magasanikbacteria bacterium RIFCSPLOWO2_12_FULL_47_9b]